MLSIELFVLSRYVINLLSIKLARAKTVWKDVCVFTAFTEGIVKKLKLHKTSGQVHTSVILLPLAERLKEDWSSVLLREKY